MVGKPAVYDFSGWATKYNQKCTDGRVILPGAFKGGNGMTVPLVWHHVHDDPTNVLGHAYLEHRAEGVYAYGVFNNTPNGLHSKQMVHDGDIQFLSIYANDLVEQSKRVEHGSIREVSLVMAGANPEARIDNISLAHSDGSDETVLEDEAIIRTDEMLVPNKMTKISHAAGDSSASENSDETIGDVLETLNEKQKTAVYALLAQALESQGGEVKQSNIEEGDSRSMKSNVFDQESKSKVSDEAPVLTHADFSAIVTGAKKNGGSFRDAFLAHLTATYGIENIDYLFPDATAVNGTPIFIKRDTGWVSNVLKSTSHTPFSRIKTILADITVDEARALGYVKAGLKKEEVFALLKRVTGPCTIYKKQKLDKDDITDITDFDVVSWLKGEMRMMLDEEIARAILVGDGRDVTLGNGSANPDKIDEACIRPIWKDDDMYSHHVALPESMTDINDVIDAIAAARANYKGAGNPTMYTTSTILSKMMLVRDEMGRRMYDSQAALEAALRVSSIVEVPVMENLTRTTGTGPTEKHLKLLAIISNLTDYSVGADKGGAVSMFEDFDIDYNQNKFLIETRCSGALTAPKAALVIEQEYTPAQ